MNIVVQESRYFNICERSVSDNEGVNKDKIALFSHPADVEAHQDIVFDLLSIYDCSVYVYMNESGIDDSLFSLWTGKFKLMVFAISERFIRDDSFQSELLRLAIKSKVKLLPILIEHTGNIGRKFSSIYGSIHLIDKTRPNYDVNLRSFIESKVREFTNIGQEHKSHFRFKAFISYRKKDRAYLMRLLNGIHDIPQLMDMAIFYDDELIPGEDYRSRLTDEMHTSDVVFFVVTPRILERGNFVLCEEYPQAVKEHKMLIPVIMDDVDHDELFAQYPEFAEFGCLRFDHIMGICDDEWSEEMRSISSIYGIPSELSPEDKYYLAAAHVNGFGTAKDTRYAYSLFRESAQDGYYYAKAKIAFMHYNSIIQDEYIEQTEELIDDAVRSFSEIYDNKSKEDDDAYSFGMTYAELTFDQFNILWKRHTKEYLHGDLRDNIIEQKKAVSYLYNSGILASGKYPLFVPMMRCGMLYLYEGNLNCSMFELSQAEKFLKPALATENIYARFYQICYLTTLAHWDVCAFKKGNRSNLDYLLEILGLFNHIIDMFRELDFPDFAPVTETIKQTAEDYYYVCSCINESADTSDELKGIAVRGYGDIIDLLTNYGYMYLLPGDEIDLNDYINCEKPLRYDLNFESTDELKMKLDKLTDWYEQDFVDEDEQREAFCIGGGFVTGELPEGRWGYGNSVFCLTDLYKCPSCNERLYSCSMRGADPPKLQLHPDNYYIEPANVYICPACRRMYAVPKGNKLFNGHVFESCLKMYPDNKLGTALSDCWIEYFTRIKALL